jgi:hypothetical protein
MTGAPRRPERGACPHQQADELGDRCDGRRLTRTDRRDRMTTDGDKPPRPNGIDGAALCCGRSSWV